MVEGMMWWGPAGSLVLSPRCLPRTLPLLRLHLRGAFLCPQGPWHMSPQH